MQKFRCLGFAGFMLLATTPAQAEVSGTVAVISEYLYRGVVQSEGVAVQGSIDWTHAAGYYASAWASNNAALGGTEVDFSGGWKLPLTETLRLDLGAVYYLFTEDREAGDPDFDYYEVYAGIEGSRFHLRGFYTPEYAGDLSAVPGFDQDAYYLYGDYSLPLSDMLSITAQGGYSAGEGIEASFGGIDSYFDYSLTLGADIGSGYDVSLGVVDTDLPGDKVKFVAGIRMSFAF